MTYESNKEEWDAEWKEAENIEATASPIGIWLRSQRIIHIKDIMKNMDKSLSVIDMGCGAGTTLKVIRGLGFKNSIGIDFSKEAIKRCEKLGFVKDKDVFNMDAGDTGYPDRHFGIGFEEGLWEHFEYPEPLVREAARISDEYMLIIQPNHFSPLGGFFIWLGRFLVGVECLSILSIWITLLGYLMNVGLNLLIAVEIGFGLRMLSCLGGKINDKIL